MNNEKMVNRDFEDEVNVALINLINALSVSVVNKEQAEEIFENLANEYGADFVGAIWAERLTKISDYFRKEIEKKLA